MPEPFETKTSTSLDVWVWEDGSIDLDVTDIIESVPRTLSAELTFEETERLYTFLGEHIREYREYRECLKNDLEKSPEKFG